MPVAECEFDMLFSRDPNRNKRKSLQMQRLDYELRRGGILISFLPKNRASKEYAPGPRAAIEAAVNADRMSWNTLGIPWSTRKANSRRQHRVAQYGVRKPKNKDNPTNATNASSMWAQPAAESLWVSTISVRATTQRKTPRATPAMPAGKIENNLCTLTT
jgi:hypothetical protein